MAVSYGFRRSTEQASAAPAHRGVYEDLASGFSPRSILELGIFQGGSHVFLDKVFKPRRTSAVEISPQPAAPLLEYLSRTEKGAGVQHIMELFLRNYIE